MIVRRPLQQSTVNVQLVAEHGASFLCLCLCLELALAEKEKDFRVELREAVEEAATKYRLLQLKYLSASSRFWLGTMFRDFAAFAQTVRLPVAIRFTNTGINEFLVDNPSVWQAFAENENISLAFPFNLSFPGVSRSLLYGRLSDQVHEPPGLVVLRLWKC